MRVAFRADASLHMGSGHVMRCLTLADTLTAQGAQCHFISRIQPGHLTDAIFQRGYMVNGQPAPAEYARGTIKSSPIAMQDLWANWSREPAHAAWLGTTWQADAADTVATLASLKPDWLVVDHYALDQRWETALAPHCKKIMVIDDLADRPHHCHLLLDQNLGRQPEDYAGLVSAQCQLLIGSRYALLRPEFAALRAYSLQRRAQPALKNLLITMGGVDQHNATGQVLEALKCCTLPPECPITVVMGQQAPWLLQVQRQAHAMPWPTEVLVNINDMAQRMADSDLAIGAAGSTSWERCCLGLPTLMVVLADNQMDAAKHLEQTGAAVRITLDGQLQQHLQDLIRHLVNGHALLAQMRDKASSVTNGLGVLDVLNALEKL